MKFFIFIFLVSVEAFAADFSENLAASLGVAGELGRFSNSSANLSERTISGAALSAMGGYELSSSVTLGLLGQYRLQKQVTSLSDVNNTNVSGGGWFIGPAANYQINQKWSAQAAALLLGQYDFSMNDLNKNVVKLSDLLGLELKAQYYFRPQWSADVSAALHKWKTITTNTSQYIESRQWVAGIGITYHWGARGATPAVALVAEVPELPAAKVAADVVPAGVPENSTKIASVQPFGLGSSRLDPSLKNQIKEKFTLIKNAESKQKIYLYGHTDSSGNVETNKKLSEARAQNVKAELVRLGVKAEQIILLGLGAAEPLSDNSAEQGKLENRRVEIWLGEKK